MPPVATLSHDGLGRKGIFTNRRIIPNTSPPSALPHFDSARNQQQEEQRNLQTSSIYSRPLSFKLHSKLINKMAAVSAVGIDTDKGRARDHGEKAA